MIGVTELKQPGVPQRSEEKKYWCNGLFMFVALMSRSMFAGGTPVTTQTILTTPSKVTTGSELKDVVTFYKDAGLDSVAKEVLNALSWVVNDNVHYHS